MSKKRRRDIANADAQAIEIYEDLADENEEIRLKAAKALLEKISPERNPSGDEVQRVIRRLFRGLCSSRKAARLGFSVALTELLVQHVRRGSEEQTCQSVADIIGILQESSQVTGQSSGQEERDHYLGRLFGARAIIKSGILSTPGTASSPWESVFNLIVDLAKKKAWLREECGWVLHGALKCLGAGGDHDAENLLRMFDSNGLSKTPEGIALWVTARCIYPDIQVPKKVWKQGDPLHRTERTSLARALKETSNNEDSNDGKKIDVQRGTWVPKLHYAWEVVFEELLNSEPSRMEFSDLWVEAVDNGLFASSSSEERKFWGFLLFERHIQTLPQHVLPTLFGPNFLKCLVNQLASKDRYLHRAARRSLDAIHARVDREPNIAGIVVQELSENFINFDSLTKTRTLERLVSQADMGTLRTIVTRFGNLILEPKPKTTEEKAAAITRQLLADYLVSVVKPKAASPERGAVDIKHQDCMLQITTLFLRHAYFQVQYGVDQLQKIPTPPISASTRDMFKTRLMSSLKCLMTNSDEPAFYPYRVLSTIWAREEVDCGLVPVIKFNPANGIGQSVAQARKILKQVHDAEQAVNKEQKEKYRAFKLLYTMILLQIYNGDTEAVGMIDEIKACCNSLVIRQASHLEDEGSVILVEILLTLVSKSSQLFKSVAQLVFSAYTSAITANALASMIHVIETKETISGQQNVFEEVDEPLEHASISDEEVSDVEEIEVVEDEKSNASMVDEDSESSTEDGELSDESEDSDTELAEFNAKLAQALGTRPPGQDPAANDEGSSADSDMDDAQMEALDAQLSTVFRERNKATPKKNSQKEARETIILFKSRVLELLEIYIKHQFLNPLATDLIVPLLTLIRTTTSKQVSAKACALIREFSKLYKIKARPSPNPNIISASTSLLDDVHAAALKHGSNAYGNACSQASILAAKILIANGGNPDAAVARYAETQKAWLKDAKCGVRTAFFTDWLNWCTSARKNLGG